MANVSPSASSFEEQSGKGASVAKPSPSPKSPPILNNRYRLLKVLGRGGFGVTILAKDYQLPGAPFCVIKQLCPLIRDQETLIRARHRFQREARTLANLGGHAQIPLLLNYFEQKGHFFLVQEFIEGETLTQQVKNEGVWTEERVIKTLYNILPVLDYVHQQGVIHRDIKPSNIMQCTFDKRFVLLDFGAMKSALATEDSVVDLTRQFVGTTGFAPPEQQQLRPCFASDLYALGMTCLFLLSGRWPQAFPWDKRQRLVLWREVISVSQPFEKFLDRLLAPELLERYRCVADALQGLAQLQSAGGSFQASLTSLGPQYQDLEACLHTQLPQRRYRRPGSS